jgi:hypothetical protein
MGVQQNHFNVNVRTNKENYEINDKIIFNIETDRDRLPNITRHKPKR